MLSLVIKARCDHGTVSYCRRSARRRWGWASTQLHRLESTFLKNGVSSCESGESRRSAEVIQHTVRRDVLEFQIHFHRNLTEIVGQT
jgi:hypothetical protein